MEITVGTDDLRRALRAVAPHADPDPDFPMLHRIRLEAGAENLSVSATNRYTVGHAIVSIWDHGQGELGHVDLSPLDVKQILVLFKGKAGSDDTPDDTLKLAVDDTHLVITDVSGLFAGKSLKLPRYPDEENFPDIQHLIATKLAAGKKATERLLTSGSMLGLFMKAASAYAEPLVLDPAGEAGALLITCGESFVGLLMPIKPDEDELAKINRWHFDWLNRFADRIPVARGRKR